MRIYFDTEFLEDGKTIELISIGLVREDGATFYAETYEAYDLAGSDPWLCENVLPGLHENCTPLSKTEIAKQLVVFCGEKPEFWAWYADYDWVALCQLFGRMVDLPEGWPMYCRDLKQVVDMMVGEAKPPKQQKGEHDALADALWLRESYLWVERQMRGNLYKLRG